MWIKCQNNVLVNTDMLHGIIVHRNEVQSIAGGTLRENTVLAACRNPDMAARVFEEINQAIVEGKGHFDISTSSALA